MNRIRERNLINRRSKWRSRIWEFNSTDNWTAIIFDKICHCMHIPILDEDIDDFYDSVIKFSCTSEERKRLEHILRRYLRLDQLYLGNLDDYQSNQKKLYEEGYMII